MDNLRSLWYSSFGVRNMANYTTSTSDKSKDEALKRWKLGALGLFGLEYFYVGRVKAGIVRVLIGVFLILGIFSGLIGGSIDFLSAIIGLPILWAIIATPNFYRLKMGTFRDNVGNPLRE